MSLGASAEDMRLRFTEKKLRAFCREANTKQNRYVIKKKEKISIFIYNSEYTGAYPEELYQSPCKN